MSKPETVIPGKFKIYYMLLCLIPCLLIGFISTLRGTALIASFIIVISMAVMWVWLFKYRSDTLILIIFIAFALRIVLAVMQTFIITLPDSSADAKVFEQLGWNVASAWNRGMPPPETPGAYLYSKLIGIVYYLTGHAPFMVLYLNVILGVLTVYFVYKLILKISGNKKAANTGAFIAAFYPTLNLYSAVTVRENIITFFSVLSVYCFIKWIRGGYIREIIKSLLFLVIAASLHGAVILIGGVYFFFYCFYNPQIRKWGFANKQSFFVLLGLVIAFVLFRSALLNKLPSDITLLLSPEYLKSRLEPLAIGRGAYLTGYYPGSLSDIFVQTPVRIVYFLFMPFPWEVKGLADFIGFIDALLYAVLVVCSVRGLGKLDRRGKLMYLAVLSVVFIEVVAFAWGTSNYGTAIRHRQKIVCLLIPMASLGIASDREAENKNGS